MNSLINFIFQISYGVRWACTLQRQNAENLKQIFPEKEYWGLSPNFHIPVSVSELYIPTLGSAFSAGGNMWTAPGNMSDSYPAFFLLIATTSNKNF